MDASTSMRHMHRVRQPDNALAYDSHIAIRTSNRRSKCINGTGLPVKRRSLFPQGLLTHWSFADIILEARLGPGSQVLLPIVVLVVLLLFFLIIRGLVSLSLLGCS